MRALPPVPERQLTNVLLSQSNRLFLLLGIQRNATVIRANATAKHGPFHFGTDRCSAARRIHGERHALDRLRGVAAYPSGASSSR